MHIFIPDLICTMGGQAHRNAFPITPKQNASRRSDSSWRLQRTARNILQQAAVLVLDYRVTLANVPLRAGPVQHGDAAEAVAPQRRNCGLCALAHRRGPARTR